MHDLIEFERRYRLMTADQLRAFNQGQYDDMKYQNEPTPPPDTHSGSSRCSSPKSPVSLGHRLV